MLIDFLDLFRKRVEGGNGVIPEPSAQPQDNIKPLGVAPASDEQTPFLSGMFGSDPSKREALGHFLLNGGAGMMAAGGPSTDPGASSFLGNMGKGLAVGGQAYANYGKDQVDNEYKRALVGQAKAKQEAAAQQKQLISGLFGNSGEAGTSALMPSGSGSAEPTSDLAGTINAQRNKFEKLYTGLMQLNQGDDARPVFAQMNQLDNEMAKNGMVWDGGKYTAAPGYNEGLRSSEAAKVAGQESERLTDGQREYRFDQQNPEYVTPQEQKALDDAAARKSKVFGTEQDIRKEYTSSPIYKRYDNVRASYDRIQSGSQRDSGAGDLGVIYGYMKMLDPGSVVREGEFATAENASGIPTYVSNLYNKLLNGERLTGDQRKEFVSASKDLYAKEAGKMGELNTQFRDIATAQNLDPSKIITEPKDYEPKRLPWPKVGELRKTDDGRTVRYRGGNPNDSKNWEDSL